MNLKKTHPKLNHDIDTGKAEEYERLATVAMTMNEADLVSFIPEYGIATYCDCPSCHSGIQQEQRFIWTFEQPDVMTCKYCGQTFPDAKFPENEKLTGQNAVGEEVNFPFYRNPKTGAMYFPGPHLLMYRSRWLIDQCRTMGMAYQVTGNETYAQKVVIVLDKIASVYPHYPVLRNNPTYFRFAESQTPPFPWDGGRWKYVGGEIPEQVVGFYDLVYDSPAFEALSAQRGYDVRSRLETGFLRAAFEAENAKPSHITNWCAYLGHAAELGRVIGEPQYIHWAFHWIRENIYGGFFHDGMWRESPSYHDMTVSGLESAMNSLRGYTDPPGYTNTLTGRHFDNCAPEKMIPAWEGLINAPDAVAFPDGRPAPFHDAWGDFKHEISGAEQNAKSAILPGMGHAVIGSGLTQAHLHFSGEYGHAHFDGLNLILWSKGREILSDMGYTWSKLRQWTRSAPAHNTVVVNRENHAKRPNITDGDLLYFFPDNNGISMVEADCKRAYCHVPGIEIYKRMLVLIPMAEGNAYLVDIFTVKGGETHDWMLHGDSDFDMDAACSLDLPNQRESMLETDDVFEEPMTEYAETNWYGMLRSVSSGIVPEHDVFNIAFTYKDNPSKGVVTYMGCDVETEIFLGKSPSPRRLGRHSSADDRKAYNYWTPHMCVRRKGVSNIFAAVHEPFEGTHLISKVEHETLAQSGQATVIKVTHGSTVDTIIYSHCPAKLLTPTDNTAMRGKLGIVREEKGKQENMWLFDGTELLSGALKLKQEPFVSGVLTGTTRKENGAIENAFLTSTPLPEKLAGRWMIVTHGNGFKHGYLIKRIERKSGETAIILEHDHGLVINDGNTKEVFFPQRTITGENTFVVPNCSSKDK